HGRAPLTRAGHVLDGKPNAKKSLHLVAGQTSNKKLKWRQSCPPAPFRIEGCAAWKKSEQILLLPPKPAMCTGVSCLRKRNGPIRANPCSSVADSCPLCRAMHNMHKNA